ncbi:hypothetical protein TSAR_001656 [Trichomalopsis sarcophagae]|uniref:Uncharacterized protein n=1 Tax=Trichomalopsis sarcophagae TaxID=543379 RepID=A0A232FKK0_9HYME|nr:hypothetical protein TSAR_001656 [Trichomalopsis sarcophagae]
MLNLYIKLTRKNPNRCFPRLDDVLFIEHVNKFPNIYIQNYVHFEAFCTIQSYVCSFSTPITMITLASHDNDFEVDTEVTEFGNENDNTLYCQ